MAPKFLKGERVYVKLYGHLNNRDIGFFMYNNKLLIRRFVIRKDDVVLRALDPYIKDIVLNRNSEYYIIGKILGKVPDNID